MHADSDEENPLKSLIHDINGQLFLIRGHCEIAKITSMEDQRAKSLDQIAAGTNEVERLIRELRVELGFPKVVIEAQKA